MEMNLRESYLAMFYLLDGYYDTTKNNILGIILGSLNPNLFNDGMPADSAAWIDWKNCIQKTFNKEILSQAEVFQAIIVFLGFYQEEFGYNLNWILNELKNGQQGKKWEDIIYKVTNEA